ncbi:hypothetical protein BJ085DRAFT_35250, partial [Dimargaris cristalligena]
MASLYLPLISSNCLEFNTQGNSEWLSITLDSTVSNFLLGVNTCLVQPLELMLAALFQALYSLTHTSTITVFNESHGRHVWDTNLDPSGTVGWFTTLVPCLAQIQPSTLWTPSDFPGLKATLPELMKLESELISGGIAPHDIEDLYPMLPMQQGMWTATAKNSSEYMIQLALTITGVTDLDQIYTATKAIVADHAILRTMFLTTWSNQYCNGIQIVIRAPHFEWHVLNEWVDAGANCEDELLRLNQERGFTQNEPLLRVYVKQLSSTSFRYLLAIHHALTDGWSMGLIFQQLQMRLQNRLPSQSGAALFFRDYARYCLNSYTPEAKLFWGDYLQGVEQPTELELPKPLNGPRSRCMLEFHFTLFSEMIPFEHHHLAKINAWVDGEVRPSDMFNTLVVYENYPANGLENSNQTVTVTETMSVESTEYPLTVIAQVEHDEINVCLSWDSSQFGQHYVETLARHLCTLFNGLVCALEASEKHTLIDDLPMLSANETALVTEQFSRPTLAIDFDASVPRLFTDSAKAIPDTIAVEYKDIHWTYRELYNQSINLAHRLQHYGVQREASIGLLIDRLPSTIAAFMGVHQAGAAFVPLDPTFPVDRLSYIVEDCGIRLVLTNIADRDKLESIRRLLAGIEFLAIDDCLLPLHLLSGELPQLPLIKPTDLSHILYTSGTTGRPKGVQLEHRLMANYVQQAESTVCITPGLRLMQNMALTFDGALLEIFTCLCKGGTIVMRTDILDTLPMVEALLATPTVLASLDPSKYPKLKKVMAAGEALPRQVAERWANHCRVFNFYGPTECLMSHSIEYTPGSALTVGKPVPNTEAYILDRNLRPVPVGVRGEICVAGIQVTRGYVNLPELTRERLLPNPFTGNGLLYRTGDTGRWLADGTVEYFSRHDDQVKIRGHRIEPQEIETVLLSHPDVKSAAVVIVNRKIYAFVCPSSVTVESVKSHIGRILPAYMNPNAIFYIDELPRNTNGKTDKHALAARIAELTSMDTGRTITAPQNPVQVLVVEALSQTLDIPCDQIDIYDSFFQLGGDSISAIRLSSLCRDRGLHISIAQ